MGGDLFPEVGIGDVGGDRLVLRVLGRMHPGATDYGDGNWLSTQVRLVVGQFDVEVGASLRSEEFRKFKEQLDELYATLNGEAAFISMEKWLDLRVRVTGSGSLKIAGKLRDRPGVGNELIFEIDGLDQSYLPGIIEDLAKIRSLYPEFD